MGIAVARKADGDTTVTATVRHPRVVAAVKLLRTRVVQVAPGVFVRGDDVLATPAVEGEKSEKRKAKSEKQSQGNKSDVSDGSGRSNGSGLVLTSHVSRLASHREPGSDNHVPRQQDVFLTCGDPVGTLPCACVFDRAHSARHGSHFVAAAVDGCGARAESTARRYPPCLLNVRGYSIDAQADALFEMQQRLMRDGLTVHGVGEGQQRDQLEKEWRNRVFAHRDEQSVKRMLRRAGLSRVASRSAGSEEGGDEG